MLLAFAAISSGCARTPQTLAITDLQGITRPYYQEDEAMTIQLGWDFSRDAGKVFECSFANAFTGEVVWKGVATAPEVESGQKIVRLDWSPPMPAAGIKAKGGEYVSSCNFGNETVVSAPVSVRTPFSVMVTDMKGEVRPYFAVDEAMMLRVNWDTRYDEDKTIDCSILNSFNGEQIWQGEARIPSVEETKKIATLDWQPQFPFKGIRLKRGNYSASCNFNDEKMAVIPISVTNVKTWP